MHGAQNGSLFPRPRRFARRIFSTLKIAGIDLGADGFRVSGRRLFPYRPNSWSDECQHPDIARRGFDEVRKKYSALYFCLVGDDEKESDGRGSVLSSARGLAEG